MRSSSMYFDLWTHCLKALRTGTHRQTILAAIGVTHDGLLNAPMIINFIMIKY